MSCDLHLNTPLMKTHYWPLSVIFIWREKKNWKKVLREYTFKVLRFFGQKKEPPIVPARPVGYTWPFNVLSVPLCFLLSMRDTKSEREGGSCVCQLKYQWNSFRATKNYIENYNRKSATNAVNTLITFKPVNVKKDWKACPDLFASFFLLLMQKNKTYWPFQIWKINEKSRNRFLQYTCYCTYHVALECPRAI